MWRVWVASVIAIHSVQFCSTDMIAYYRWVPLMWLHSEPFVSLRAGVSILFYCKMPRTNSTEWFQSASDAVNCISECLICSLNGLNECSLSPVAPDAACHARTRLSSGLTCLCYPYTKLFSQVHVRRRSLITTVLRHNRANASRSALHDITLTAHRNRNSIEI